MEGGALPNIFMLNTVLSLPVEELSQQKELMNNVALQVATFTLASNKRKHFSKEYIRLINIVKNKLKKAAALGNHNDIYSLCTLDSYFNDKLKNSEVPNLIKEFNKSLIEKKQIAKGINQDVFTNFVLTDPKPYYNFENIFQKYKDIIPYGTAKMQKYINSQAERKKKLADALGNYRLKMANIEKALPKANYAKKLARYKFEKHNTPMTKYNLENAEQLNKAYKRMGIKRSKIPKRFRNRIRLAQIPKENYKLREGFNDAAEINALKNELQAQYDKDYERRQAIKEKYKKRTESKNKFRQERRAEYKKNYAPKKEEPKLNVPPIFQRLDEVNNPVNNPPNNPPDEDDDVVFHDEIGRDLNEEDESPLAKLKKAAAKLKK